MNAHLVENADEIPFLDETLDKIQNTYRLNTSLLKRFLQPSYDDERQGQRTRPRNVEPLNASQVKLISKVLLDSATLEACS